MCNKSITLFGDSILFGIICNPDTKRYVKPKEYDLKEVGSSKGFDLTNMSRMGRDSSEGKQTIQNYLSSHPAPDYAIIEFGGNDCTYNWSELSLNPQKENGHPKIEYDRYIKNLTEMVSLLESKGTKVSFMNLPPVLSAQHLDWITKDGLNKSNILEFLGDAEQINRTHSEYNHGLEKLANTLSLPLIDVRSKFLGDRHTELMSIDGVHPSREGLKLIVNGISDYLDEIS